MANPAAQNLEFALHYDDGGGADWQTLPVRTGTPVTINRGLADTSLEPVAGSAAVVVDNLDGQINPAHPQSPLYGVAGRNTPARIREGTSTRLIGRAASYQTGRSAEPVTGDRGDAWTTVQVSGILAQLGGGDKPARPPLYRAHLSGAPTYYWPLSDPAGSTRMASGLSGGTPLIVAGTPGLASVPGFDGDRASFPQLAASDGSSYSGGFELDLTGMGSSGFTVDAWVRQSTSDDTQFSNATWARLNLTGGTLQDDDGAGLLFGATTEIPPAPSQNLFVSNFATLGGYGTQDFVAADTWHHIRVSIDQVTSTTVDIFVWVDGALVDSDTGAAGVIGTPGRLEIAGPYLTGGALPEFTAGLSVAHFALWDTADPPISAAEIYEAGTGHTGERAGTRFLRLCAEEGVNATLIGSASDTVRMGPQPTDRFLELAKECPRSDGGLLTEDRIIARLTMVANYELCNQLPVISLTHGQVSPKTPLAPVYGDYGVRNEVVAVNRTGSSARATLDEGRLSVQDPPDGIGRGYDTELKVNLYDDRHLKHAAYWHLHVWSADVVRYPTITVDVVAVPAKATQAASADPGTLIQVTDVPDDPDLVEQMIIGVGEQIPSHGRVYTYRCIPGTPWRVGIIGATDGSVDLRGQAIDTDLSTLASGVDADDTTLSVASTGGVLWTTDPDDWDTDLHGTAPDGTAGLVITVGGEDLRVTDIAGASSPQTFTVVRSINGVTKSHPAGAPVHVRYPAVISR